MVSSNVIPAERPLNGLKARVSPIVSTRKWQVARKGVPVDEGVRDAGGSECRAVIARIGVRDLPCSERRLTSGRSWITRKERKG